MKKSDWIILRQKTLEAFANILPPDFDSVSILGCRERHEKDFDYDELGENEQDWGTITETLELIWLYE